MVEFDLRHFGSKKLLLSPVSVSVWISIVSSSVSIVSVWSESVSVVSIVSISISLSISLWVGISISLSFWLSISISLSVVSVSVWVSISIGSVSVWSQAISVVSIPSIGISVSTSISLWFSICRSLTIVSIWETIVGVGMGVDMGSIGVGEWSIMSISVSVVSAVQQPWVSLWVSFGISLSSWLSLSLLNRLNSLFGFSSSRSYASNKWESAMGAWDKFSLVILATSSQRSGIDQRMVNSIGQNSVSVDGGNNSGSGVDESRVGLSLDIGSDSYHQQELHVVVL